MSKSLSSGVFTPGEPLWKRVPSRGGDGKALYDLMMLIPRLGKSSEIRQREVLLAIESVISDFGDEVVFADLNLKTNLLWVSIKPRHRATLEFAAAIRRQIPEALLIANQADLLAAEMMGAGRRKRWQWLPRWGINVGRKLLR